MKRSSKKLPKDSNKLAAEIVRLSTEEPEEDSKTTPPKDQPQEPSKEALSQYFSKLGKKGGEKGGKARAESLTAKKRKEIAQKAAKARWNKNKLDKS
ncbi:MAG TPA: hypothetical protein VFA47_07695 [Candidatus Manganitrophaceae bacterium]|nr:hypothetical protein [Candidatus Manganitrophaceae bacterium]